MKTIEQLRKEDPTINELKEEIRQRREFIGQCVGWLYPSILSDEIVKIQDMIDVIVREAADRSTM